ATTERNNGVEIVLNGAFEGSAAELPTPTEAEQILLIAQNANTTATQANETANTANSNANAADEKAQLAINTFPYCISGATVYGGTIADNLNTITKNGFYTCYGSAVGAPINTTSWFVTHQNSNVGTAAAHQRAVAYNTTFTVRERIKLNGVWGAWVNTL
ncbi:MAG TPA: hypothetical protein DDW34_06785, partial [Clostridium sp.]|nr:hypothetical protein [Clostridium sp.]